LFNTNPVSASGSSFADFLVGIPQEVMIESPNQKAYMRQNDWQAFIRDDWRVTPTFTLLAGVRYNYFSPYAEKYDHLSTLDYVPNGGVPLPVQPNGIGPVSGAKYPRTLIYPERNNFSPHLGFAWQASSSTVVRTGYGIHYTVGQYGSFMQSLAYQTPFANTLTVGNTLLKFQDDDRPPVYAPLFHLADAFNVQAGDGNYAINRHYRVPYIQFWSADVEQTLPLQIVIDASYTGAKGTRLDTITAPGLFNQSSIASLFFDYQDSTAFSNFNALTVTATKRLQNGLALSATYIYSHSIDNAASINAGSPVVAQNPDDLLAEEGNSNFDIRHQLYGSFFYELPFGPNMPFLNSGHWVSRIFGDWSLAGTFAATSGLPLTPYVAASAVEVARGTHGSVRPNRNFGVPVMAGGGHANHWFNTKAFSTQFAPGQLYGTASRNSIPGPGLLNASASLSKTFLIRDSESLELRCTAANVFNAVQYSAVNTQFDSPTVGQVTATQSMRQLTFLGRFRF
jgi:trimeric autotransporter adhesin